MRWHRIILLIMLIIIFLSTFLFNFYLFKYENAYEEASQRLKAVLFMSFLTIICFLYAKIEIEIEGEHGWAQNLPTWTYKPEWLVDFMNGKYLTGYHTFLMILFLPMIFHFPLFFTTWNIYKECAILGAYFYFIVMEDFLWFAFNNKFGLKKFNSRNKKIWWHKEWFGPLPDMYLESLLIAFILLSLGLPYI